MTSLGSVAVFTTGRRWPLVLTLPMGVGEPEVLEAVALVAPELSEELPSAVLRAVDWEQPGPFADPPGGPVTGPLRPGVALSGALPLLVADRPSCWWLLTQADLRVLEGYRAA